MTHYHLSPHAEGWKLTTRGSERIIDIFRIKEDAVSVCGDIIQERDGGLGSLTIHHRDGTIEEERTYPRGADPKASPG